MPCDNSQGGVWWYYSSWHYLYRFKQREFYPNDIMVSVVQEGYCKGFESAYLAKIRCISEDTANNTIYIITHRSVCMDNPKLSRICDSNGKMCRYIHLNNYLYIDTLFTWSKAQKKTRWNMWSALCDGQMVHLRRTYGQRVGYDAIN